MTDQELARIAKLCYEDAMRRYRADWSKEYPWEKAAPDVHDQWVACVKLVEYEMGAEVERLRALARKYAGDLYRLEGERMLAGPEEGWNEDGVLDAHQARLREIGGGK